MKNKNRTNNRIRSLVVLVFRVKDSDEIRRLREHHLAGLAFLESVRCRADAKRSAYRVHSGRNWYSNMSDILFAGIRSVYCVVEAAETTHRQIAALVLRGAGASINSHARHSCHFTNGCQRGQ
jgi:hypothetical protein